TTAPSSPTTYQALAATVGGAGICAEFSADPRAGIASAEATAMTAKSTLRIWRRDTLLLCARSESARADSARAKILKTAASRPWRSVLSIEPFGLPARRRPHLGREALRLGGRRCPPVLLRSAKRVDDGARGSHERAGGPAREGTRDIRGSRALSADSREEQERLRHQLPCFRHPAWVGRADDGAHARKTSLPDEWLTPVVDVPCDVLPEGTTVEKRRVLHVGRSGVRRPHEEEHAGAVPPAGGHERLAAVVPEERVGRDGVGERRQSVPRLEKRLGIGPSRRADVSPFRVDDHEESGRARVVAHLLERPHAVGAEYLEERGLRLHADDVGPDRVHDPFAEPGDRGRRGGPPENGFSAKLHGKQIEDGVETHDELGVLALDRLPDAVCEPWGGRPYLERALHLRHRIGLHAARISSRDTTRSSGPGRRRKPAITRRSSASSGENDVRST